MINPDMTGTDHHHPGCACIALSAYDCWARRYGLRDNAREKIEWDGGPCTCECHDEIWEGEI